MRASDDLFTGEQPGQESPGKAQGRAARSRSDLTYERVVPVTCSACLGLFYLTESQYSAALFRDLLLCGACE